MTEKEKNEQLEDARKKLLDVAKERRLGYLDSIEKFDEALDTYYNLIAVVKENKSRFKKYDDLLAQFNATVESYRTQKDNLYKAANKLNRMLLNESKYTNNDFMRELRLE